MDMAPVPPPPVTYMTTSLLYRAGGGVQVVAVLLAHGHSYIQFSTEGDKEREAVQKLLVISFR